MQAQTPFRKRERRIARKMIDGLGTTARVDASTMAGSIRVPKALACEHDFLSLLPL